MDTEQITQIILQLAPSIIAILTVVGMVLKMTFQFKSLKAQVVDMKSVEEIRDQLKIVLQENYELKHTLNETMTKIDHVQRNTPSSKRG